MSEVRHLPMLPGLALIVASISWSIFTFPLTFLTCIPRVARRKEVGSISSLMFYVIYYMILITLSHFTWRYVYFLLLGCNIAQSFKYVCKHCLSFSHECSEFSQSLDFPSLACLHMPSVASAHAQ